jgi:hypothetical protein
MTIFKLIIVLLCVITGIVIVGLIVGFMVAAIQELLTKDKQ